MVSLNIGLPVDRRPLRRWPASCYRGNTERPRLPTDFCSRARSARSHGSRNLRFRA